MATGTISKNVAADVEALNRKLPLQTFSSAAGTVVGNFISGYGCVCFVPMQGASDYVITIDGISVYGSGGDKKSDFTLGTQNQSGFVLNTSVNYSGRFISVTYTATPIV